MIVQCNAAGFADPDSYEYLIQAKAKNEATAKQDIYNQIPALLTQSGHMISSAPLDSMPHLANNHLANANKGIIAALSLMQQNIDTILFAEQETNTFRIDTRILGDFDRIIRKNQTGSANQFDTDTIDVIRMLFDIIFENNQLTDEFKRQLAKLQIPLLKVAIIDNSYFGNDSHPADQLINKLTDAALALKKNGNIDSASFHDEVKHIVNRIINEFTDDPVVFMNIMSASRLFKKKAPRNKRATLNQGLKDTTKKLQSLCAKPIPVMRPELKHKVTKSSAEVVSPINPDPNPANTKNSKQQISTSIKSKVLHCELPGEVREFLTTTWVDVASCILNAYGDKSTNWKNSMQVVDELTWVFQPMTNIQEKIKLSNIIPHLITNIQVGLMSTKCNSDHKPKIFSTLLSIHAANLKDQKLNNYA